MELFKQILASFEGSIPNDSKTFAAIARGAGPEEVSCCATSEGLHALAAALFEACEEGLVRMMRRARSVRWSRHACRSSGSSCRPIAGPPN